MLIHVLCSASAQVVTCSAQYLDIEMADSNCYMIDDCTSVHMIGTATDLDRNYFLISAPGLGLSPRFKILDLRFMRFL